MPSTPSPLLRIELQELGENLDTWGKDRLNNALRRLEEGIADVVTLTISGATYTVNSQNYVADEARAAVLVITGTLGAHTEIVPPTVKKTYLIVNSTTQGLFSLTIKTAGGVGYALRQGPQRVYCDGSDFRRGTPRLDELPAPAAAVDLNGQRMTNSGTPTAPSDLVTKLYADNLALTIPGTLPGQSSAQAGLALTTSGSMATWAGAPALWCGAGGGAVNAITVSTGLSLAGLNAGLVVAFTTTARNTAAVTLNVDGLGAVALCDETGKPLRPGDAGPALCVATYDGVAFRLHGRARSRIKRLARQISDLSTGTSSYLGA